MNLYLLLYKTSFYKAVTNSQTLLSIPFPRTALTSLPFTLTTARYLNITRYLKFKHITDTGLTSLHNLSLISLGISFIPSITYDGIKSVSSPSLLYLHNAGCPLINRPETIDSIKSWSPHIKYIASTKQAICPEDPKYSDHDVIIEERNISLWVRAEDLNKTGHSPGVGIFFPPLGNIVGPCF